MAHSRVSRFPGLADAPAGLSINQRLEATYCDYMSWCYGCGIEPAQYETWKQLTDDSYKLAGVTRK